MNEKQICYFDVDYDELFNFQEEHKNCQGEGPHFEIYICGTGMGELYALRLGCRCGESALLGTEEIGYREPGQDPVENTEVYYNHIFGFDQPEDGKPNETNP